MPPVLLWLGATLGIVWSTLEELQRELLVDLLNTRGTLVPMMVVVLFGALAFALRALIQHFIETAAPLAEEGMVLVRTSVARSLPAQGSAENRSITEVVNQLVAQRARLGSKMDARVREASRAIEQEKIRLAALMAELTQSVVVCNLDGQHPALQPTCAPAVSCALASPRGGRWRRADRPGSFDLHGV